LNLLHQAWGPGEGYELRKAGQLWALTGVEVLPSIWYKGIGRGLIWKIQPELKVVMSRGPSKWGNLQPWEPRSPDKKGKGIGQMKSRPGALGYPNI
jgi:hypothetical protein